MDLQRLHGAVEAAHDSLPEKARGTWMARPVVTVVMVRMVRNLPGPNFSSESFMNILTQAHVFVGGGEVCLTDGGKSYN